MAVPLAKERRKKKVRDSKARYTVHFNFDQYKFFNINVIIC